MKKLLTYLFVLVIFFIPGAIFAQNNPEKPLYFAISAMISPQETFDSYQRLLEYISEKMERKIALKQRRTYIEVNKMLQFGEVDVAFICTGAYIEAEREFGATPLVAPVFNGKAAYSSYIIVHKDSPVKNFDQLKGKTFAFTDPLSNTGKLFPTYLVIKKGYLPSSYFSNYFYTYSHDNSIEAVAEGLVEGAAVDNLVWKYLKKINPQLVGKTKVILESPSFGSPPFVTSPAFPSPLKDRLKEVLLTMHKDPKGKKILFDLGIDRFTPGEKGIYDQVRKMREIVDYFGHGRER